MYILYKDMKYSCDCKVGATMIYRNLPDDFPSEVTGEIQLCADDDFVLRTDIVEDYLRYTFVDGVLTLTNIPESIPSEPIEPEPTQLDRIEAQVAYTAMMTDTLLEV